MIAVNYSQVASATNGRGISTHLGSHMIKVGWKGLRQLVKTSDHVTAEMGKSTLPVTVVGCGRNCFSSLILLFYATSQNWYFLPWTEKKNIYILDMPFLNARNLSFSIYYVDIIIIKSIYILFFYGLLFYLNARFKVKK